MHVCVLGGGVVGTATAYYLARDGHRVTVIERNDRAGVETSFANGGQLSYSYVAPLAAPGVLRSLPGWMLSREAPLRFTPSLSVDQWRWCALFLMACTSAQSRQSTIELLGLGAYSRVLVDELMRDEQLDFDMHRSGKLIVYRDPKQLDAAKRHMDVPAAFGVKQTALDARACIALEPALEPLLGRLAGGIHTAASDTGDCFQFTSGLARVAGERYGARFMYGTRILSLRREGQRIVAASTDRGDVQADAFVLALGNASPRMLDDLGIALRMHPLKGYSLTLPVRPEHKAPIVSVTDYHHKVVYARLGSRLRIAGMVDLTADSVARDRKRIDLLKRQAKETLPDAGDHDAATTWTGLRPATADGKPVLGASACGNLWLNTGHGPLGFTFACASGKLLSDVIGQRPAAIDLTPFRAGRRFV